MQVFHEFMQRSLNIYLDPAIIKNY